MGRFLSIASLERRNDCKGEEEGEGGELGVSRNTEGGDSWWYERGRKWGKRVGGVLAFESQNLDLKRASIEPLPQQFM